jgi:hypothetical protein
MAPNEGRGLARSGVLAGEGVPLAHKPRCTDMDSTFATTGPFLGRAGRHQPSVERTGAHWTRPDPPIYAALVADWQARGRIVPGLREAVRTRPHHRSSSGAATVPDGR